MSKRDRTQAMIKTVLSALRRTRRIGADDHGNVAMMLALSIVPLAMASMGAIDLTRGVTAKVQLQDALDAAALAVGRTNSTDAATLQSVGQRILSQNLAGTSDFSISSSSFVLGANNTIVASVQASFTPAVAGLVGSGPMTIAASTEVMRANNILEIALVLDNTGSMSQSLGWGQSSKISYLRTAASDFVDTMAKAAAQSTTPNSVQIALVPFSNTVKVGASYASAAWVDQAGVSPINDQIFTTAQGVTQHANRFTLFAQLGTSWGGCVENRQAPYDIQDTAPTSSTPATLFTPFFAPDEADGVSGANDYVNEPKKDANGNSLSWWARQGSITKYTNSPKVTLNSSDGPNAGCSMQAIQRLTTDFTTLKSAINTMSAGGDTNVPMGLVWGWHLLSPNAPFGDGVPYLTPKHKKIVVLMTDGANTMTINSSTNNKSNYSGEGYVWQGRETQADGTALVDVNSSAATRTAAMDDRLQKLCTNMKAGSVGIEIYAVGVGVTSSSQALLQACASGSDHYFDVSSGTDLTSTFQTIANQIAQLHLSK
jgi:Flp pilus assembly protein TadG